jgi:hypothetical protein
MIPALEEACGEKFPPGIELHTEETGRFLKSVLEKMKVDCSPPLTNARMLDKLVGEFIVSTTFLILINAVLTWFVGGDLHQSHVYHRPSPDDVSACKIPSRKTGPL